MAQDLARLFNQYGSDKDTNGYTALYHSLFKNMRKLEELVILEIGVGCVHLMGQSYEGHQGASLQAWAEYFPGARVYGIDVAADAIGLSLTGGRATTHYCDSTQRSSVETFVEQVRAELGLRPGVPVFDIIIDDGSHLEADQVTTLRHLFPYLKRDNSFYVLEDIGGDLRNVGYRASCPTFHPPRPVIQEIIGPDTLHYLVNDWSPRHESGVLVITL